MPSNYVDFDGEPVKLLKDVYQMAENYLDPIYQQYQRDWLSYLAYLDWSERDPNLINVALPKIYSIVEQKSPDAIDALFGRRPYIPYEARRKEFQNHADVITDMVDDLLHRANYYVDGTLISKIKTLYGTAYMSVLPYYQKVREKKLVQTPNGFQPVYTEAYRLRLKIESWAPWEILRDPFAKNLNTIDGCRYIVKIQVASKHMIGKMYERGLYPDLDLELLNKQGTYGRKYRNRNWGDSLLEAYGLNTPRDDGDIGLVLRYENPDRYIDYWVSGGKEVVLRDRDNDFAIEKGGHGLINLSKITHTTPPHTQWCWDGIGEAKPNEVQVAILNDLTSMGLRSHAMLDQPMSFYRNGAIANKDSLVFGIGQKIPVDSDRDRPLSDDIMIYSGTGLPKDHYIMQDRMERNIDMTSSLYAPSRGELSKTDNTATEIAATLEEGDTRQEQAIRYNEHEFLNDFAYKVANIVEMASNLDDKVEIVGAERAILSVSMNPSDLPGGYNIAYKGSSRVKQLALKQRAARLLAPIIQGSPAAIPGGMERKLLELHDFNTDEIGEIIMSEEMIQQMQQKQALLYLMQGMAPQGQRALPNKSQEKESPTSSAARQQRESVNG